MWVLETQPSPLQERSLRCGVTSLVLRLPFSFKRIQSLFPSSQNYLFHSSPNPSHARQMPDTLQPPTQARCRHLSKSTASRSTKPPDKTKRSAALLNVVSFAVKRGTFPFRFQLQELVRFSSDVLRHQAHTRGCCREIILENIMR